MDLSDNEQTPEIQKALVTLVENTINTVFNLADNPKVFIDTFQAILNPESGIKTPLLVKTITDDFKVRLNALSDSLDKEEDKPAFEKLYKEVIAEQLREKILGPILSITQGIAPVVTPTAPPPEPFNTGSPPPVNPLYVHEHEPPNFLEPSAQTDIYATTSGAAPDYRTGIYEGDLKGKDFTGESLEDKIFLGCSFNRNTKLPASYKDAFFINCSGMEKISGFKKEGALIAKSLNEALKMAVTKNKEKVVGLLLKKGAEPSPVIKLKYQPKIEDIRLEQSNAFVFDDVTPKLVSHAQAPLVIAVNNKNINIMKKIVDHMNDEPTIEDQEILGWALHDAMKNGDQEVISKLIQLLVGKFNEGYKEFLELALIKAASVDNLDLVKRLLALGLDYDTHDRDGNTLLISTYRRGTPSGKVFNYLLDKGADISKKNTSGYTILHFAVAFNDKDGIERLLNLNADYDHLDQDGMSPLMYAYEMAHSEEEKKTEAYDAILDKMTKEEKGKVNQEGRFAFLCKAFRDEKTFDFLCDNHVDLTKTTTEGDTALHLAVKAGYKEAVKNALAWGADYCRENNSQLNPLMLAYQSKDQRPDIFRMFLEKAQREKTPERGVKSPWASEKFLQMAVEKNDIETVQLLLKHNADPNFKTKEGNSMLHLAAMKNYAGMVKALCDAGAYMHAVETTQECEYPFYIEAKNTIKEYSQRYKVDDSGAQVTFVQLNTFVNNTALHLAAIHNCPEIIKILTNPNRGEHLSVEEPNQDGMNALHLAAKYGSVDALNALFEAAGVEKENLVNLEANRGIIQEEREAIRQCKQIFKGIENSWPNILGLTLDPSAPYKRTALHFAVESKNSEAAKVLCEKNADINKQDYQGMTPLHLAAINGDPDMVKVLCEAGADTGIKNNSNQTPQELAKKNGRTEVENTINFYAEYHKNFESFKQRAGEGDASQQMYNLFKGIKDRKIKLGMSIMAKQPETPLTLVKKYLVEAKNNHYSQQKIQSEIAKLSSGVPQNEASQFALAMKYAQDVILKPGPQEKQPKQAPSPKH